MSVKKSKSTKTAKLARTPKATKVAKKEATTREDPRVAVLLSALIKNPAATHADCVAVLKGKGQTMSNSAVRMVRRGYQQTVRALISAGKLAT